MTNEQTMEQFLLALNSNAYLNMCESADMINAIKAIEKEIPKKVLAKHGANKKEFFGNCPVCGVFTNSRRKYCCECGQALDWRD